MLNPALIPSLKSSVKFGRQSEASKIFAHRRSSFFWLPNASHVVWSILFCIENFLGSIFLNFLLWSPFLFKVIIEFYIVFLIVDQIVHRLTVPELQRVYSHTQRVLRKNLNFSSAVPPLSRIVCVAGNLGVTSWHVIQRAGKHNFSHTYRMNSQVRQNLALFKDRGNWGP